MKFAQYLNREMARLVKVGDTEYQDKLFFTTVYLFRFLRNGHVANFLVVDSSLGDYRCDFSSE
jgi:glutaredoxin 2